MKKRIAATAILTAAVMALSAGCGQKAAPTEGTGENAGSAKEKVEIEYWALPYGPSDTYDPTLQRIVDQYNAEDHGATVKLQIMSWSGFIEQIQTAIAAGSPPDVTTAAYYAL